MPPRKPTPSLTVLGRAKAKGTGQEWVNPRLTVAYTRDKSGSLDTRGVPTAVPRAVADDTAVPLRGAIARYLRQRKVR